MRDGNHGHINASGFPLQIGLAHAINSTYQEHGWRVLQSEHGWTNFDTHESGFIDLVLENRHETVVLNVECKRPQDATWQFLLPAPDEGPTGDAKFWASYMSSTDPGHFGWLDLQMRPASYESAFCVIPGQDAKSRPLLERVASQVVASTEALAEEESSVLQSRDTPQLRTYINVIVTTANLEVCRFDPDNVDLTTGKIDEVEYEEVPFIRFRKQLSPRPAADSARLWGFGSLGKAKENTVLVVQACKFIELLPQIRIDGRIGHVVMRNS